MPRWGITKEEKKRLEEIYLGKRVHVIIEDTHHYVDAWGIVEHIDDLGQLHGTWSGLAAIPGIDYIGLDD